MRKVSEKVKKNNDIRPTKPKDVTNKRRRKDKGQDEKSPEVSITVSDVR